MEELELEQSAPVLLTAAGHARLKAELQQLTVTKRAEIAARIRESKDHGEFSEDNNELDEIKIEQAMVESRITELKTILSGAEILEADRIPTDYVGLGSKVTVEDVERDFSFDIRIVASIEANADEDLISEESPMGEALLGLKSGETAEFEAPVGILKYKIKKISA
ncbi:MAG: transcription elongation factor GreA [Fimbriimonadaceae bacterium]|nr:transcription elongation factor GreA [Fimbriimonadaceae bacterium]QYK53850.1 MAG: transcription elongation factor GreA [Fimbriimonadaceae bacterium]